MQSPVMLDMAYRPRRAVQVRSHLVYNFGHKVVLSKYPFTEGRGGIYGSHMITASAIGAPRTSSDSQNGTERHSKPAQPQVVLDVIGHGLGPMPVDAI